MVLYIFGATEVFQPPFKFYFYRSRETYMLWVMRAWTPLHLYRTNGVSSRLLSQQQHFQSTSNPLRQPQQALSSTKRKNKKEEVNSRDELEEDIYNDGDSLESGGADYLPPSPYIQRKAHAYRTRSRTLKPVKSSDIEAEQWEITSTTNVEPVTDRPLRMPLKMRRDLRKTQKDDKSPVKQEFLPPRDLKTTLNKSFKRAPFATRFSMNPFAHALAEPMREDNFSSTHLPRSCLMDFFVVDTGEEQTLLPLSLAHALIPSKKKDERLTPQEREIRTLWREENHTARQTRAGSHVLNAAQAISFVSAQPTRRIYTHVISRRIHENIQSHRVDHEMAWREDMPEFLLAALRTVVRRKLSFFFRNKANKDNPGVLRAMPDQGDLLRLDEMDNLACVLRLRAVEKPEPREVETDMEMGRIGLEDGEEVNVSDGSFLQYTVPELEHEAYSSPDDEPSPPEPTPSTVTVPTTPKPHRAPGIADIAKWQEDHAWWGKSDSVHRNVKPLGSPIKLPLLHYPSVAYRRHRIPLYDLTKLLGEKDLADLVKGTVFAELAYAGMAYSLGSVGAHQWLMKLQDYLAEKES